MITRKFVSFYNNDENDLGICYTVECSLDDFFSDKQSGTYRYQYQNKECPVSVFLRNHNKHILSFTYKRINGKASDIIVYKDAFLCPFLKIPDICRACKHNKGR